MYWYIGKNSSGKIGAVPSNYLKPIEGKIKHVGGSKYSNEFIFR